MKTANILTLLREARAAATFETAGFTFPEDEAKDAEIREDTRLYRETWIIGPIDSVISEIEAEQRKRAKK